MTARRFTQLVNKYFDECEATGAFPDEAGMILALHMTRETFERIINGDDCTQELHLAALESRLRRESIITRTLFATEKAATAKIFLARQPASGALSERPQEHAEQRTVEVLLRGETTAFE